MVHEQVIWVMPDGTQVDLNDRVTYFCTLARSGMWNPSYSVSSIELPVLPGSVFAGAKIGERLIDLPVEVRAPTHTELLATLRAVAYMMNPTLGKGQLKVITPNYNRGLYCYPTGIQVGERDVTASLVLSFKANDPFWYDSVSEGVSFVQGETLPFFPIFPISLITSLNFSEDSVQNLGDVEAWPVWTVYGPASGVTLENSTTGKKIDLSGLIIEVGEKLVINTREKSIQLEISGESETVDEITALSLDSSIFSLQPGNNNLVVKLNDSTEDTRVNLSWAKRYLTI